MKTKHNALICPCRTDEPANVNNPITYEDCCQAYIEHSKLPETAEQLMRSRYTAYTQKNRHYLLQTWHPDTQPPSLTFEEPLHWLGLKVKSTQAGSADDTQGSVMFVARYKVAGKAGRLEENSHFIKINNQWFYHSALAD